MAPSATDETTVITPPTKHVSAVTDRLRSYPTSPASEYAITFSNTPSSLAWPRRDEEDLGSPYLDEETVLQGNMNGHVNGELPALQTRGNLTEEAKHKFEPINEDDPASYDLVAPGQGEDEVTETYNLEKQSQLLFSKEHLQVIFSDPVLLLRFTSFLGQHRSQSVPILVHYFDSLKALRAIHYANAILEGLEPIPSLEFTKSTVEPTVNAALLKRANDAFDYLVREELPAFIAHSYINVVSTSISHRIAGTLAPHLREASEGLAEVFCLTDPSRADNPIVFASEEFNRTTQYGMTYILGRNCRFLQGPWTNPTSVRRLREAIAAGKQCQEVFLNYRRDGSPFMNLLMIAPLCDSRGVIRYFIGAQVDVSGLVKECAELESLQRLLELQERGEQPPDPCQPNAEKNDELRELSEMLNSNEQMTIRRYGGRMHREPHPDDDSMSIHSSMHAQQPRLLLKDPNTITPPIDDLYSQHEGSVGSGASFSSRISGKLSGVYQHYLLVRPFPSLRILFASPSQRVPGILQSPFMNKIGGSNRVREELTAALADGRGVTAKVRWVSKADEEGRNKWIHCTPLVGINGAIGVWMIVIVDDMRDKRAGTGGFGGIAGTGRHAPPVTRMTPDNTPQRNRGPNSRGPASDANSLHKGEGSVQSFKI